MVNNRDHVQAIRDELESHGAVWLGIEHGGKHDKCRFRWNGVEQFYVVPISLSDNRRGTLNAVTELRRILGVKRAVKKNRGKKRRRDVCRRDEVKLGKITIKPDPFAVLANHPVAVDYSTASERFWRLPELWCMNLEDSQ